MSSFWSNAGLVGQFLLGMSASAASNFFGVSQIQSDIQTCNWGGLALNSLGAAALVGGVIIPEARGGEAVVEDAGAILRAARAEQAAANAVQGRAAEQLIQQQLVGIYGEANIDRQVYSKIPGLGVRRSDFKITTPDGSFFVEVKSGNARYGGLQLQKDQWLAQNLGIPTQLIRVP